MKVKNMRYIHDLLIENERIKRKAKSLVSEARSKAIDEGADNLGSLQKEYEKVYDSWLEAQLALEDFEEQDW